MSLTMRAASGAMNGFRRVTSMRAKPSSYQRFMCSSAASSNVSAESIIDQCLKVRESIQVLNDKFKGPLEKTSQKNTVLPFVFLLGNHSSGKSSFINYVSQRKVQTAGVAPTDDAFTILVPGPADVDRDGPSFIGDPDMGFAGLRTFGPNLVHHTQLKVRSNIAIKNFMIVDTPGMIDSPTVRDHNGNVRHAVMDRGYDFENVVKWYAERADVILLFFDPDKPGTTGETLSILTNSLVGLDHKLHIILNKADQFTKIHDFARAYGSLCWNLSKVIQRKDLPRIYTMCLPKPYQTNNGSSSSSNNGSDANSTEEHALGNGLADLESTREDVVQEVLNAPKRRIDNEITRLTDSVRLLQMHLSIVDDLSSKYRKAVWNSRLAFGSVSAAAAGLTVSAVIMGLPAEMIGGVVAIGAGAVGGVSWWQNKVVNELVSSIVSDESMSSSFRRVFARQLANKDEGISATWSRVHEHLIVAMHSEEFKHLDKISSSDMKKIENIIEIEIPNLRRLAAPAFNKNI